MQYYLTRHPKDAMLQYRKVRRATFVCLESVVIALISMSVMLMLTMAMGYGPLSMLMARSI